MKYLCNNNQWFQNLLNTSNEEVKATVIHVMESGQRDYTHTQNFVSISVFKVTNAKV